MTRTQLGGGAEFELIRRLLGASAPDPPRVVVGAGDDCALIAAGDDYLAISIDLTVEGVHFRSEWGTPELIGQRAMRAAASDLAAMGATPLAALVGFGVPRERDPSFAVQVSAGCRNAAEGSGLAIIGGDLSRGGTKLTVDVVVVGTVKEPLLRSAARAGDELYVTGSLGASAAAVWTWNAGREPPPEWYQRFWLFKPRLAEARWLAERGATAAIDVSDGLVADAGHIAAASGVAVEIEAEAVPVATSVDPQLALTGGEDYELIVTVPGGIFSDETIKEFERQFGIPLSRIGRVVVGSGVRAFSSSGEELEFAGKGFDHFA